MMLFIFLVLNASALELSEVQTKVLSTMPELLAQEEKIAAQVEKLRATQGSFDHKIKGQTRNQLEDPAYNRFWEIKIERQTPWLGSQLFAGRRQGNGTYATYEGKSATTQVGEMFAGFEIPLLRDREMDQFRLERANAQTSVLIEKVAWDQKALEVLVKASTNYWKWIAAYHKLEITKKWTEANEIRFKWIEKKIRAGDLGAIKLVDAERSLMRARSKLIETERDFSIAQQDLMLYLPGIEVKNITPKEIKAESTSVETTPANAKENLPVFRHLALERELLEQEKEYARSLMLPELRLGVEGARDLGGLAPGRTEEDQLRVALRLEVPLENNKGEGTRAAISNQLASLALRKRWLAQEWDTRITQNKTALEKINQQIKLQTSELSATTRMRETEVTKLEQGASDIFFVNIREQDEVKVKLELIESLALRELFKLEKASLDGTLMTQIKQGKKQ